MHKLIFSLIDNLHELWCRGNLDVKQALAGVQDYNMTKILTRKCSIADGSCDVKNNFVDFNILYNIQMDIELYNYIDILFHNFRYGKNYKIKENDSFNASLVFISVSSAPISLRRNNADFMNNFFVNTVARAFTDINERESKKRNENLKSR